MINLHQEVEYVDAIALTPLSARTALHCIVLRNPNTPSSPPSRNKPQIDSVGTEMGVDGGTPVAR